MAAAVKDDAERAKTEGQMTETTSQVSWQAYNPPLEPATQEFVDGVTACNSQINELTIGAARAATRP